MLKIIMDNTVITRDDIDDFESNLAKASDLRSKRQRFFVVYCNCWRRSKHRRRTTRCFVPLLFFHFPIFNFRVPSISFLIHSSSLPSSVHSNSTLVSLKTLLRFQSPHNSLPLASLISLCSFLAEIILLFAFGNESKRFRSEWWNFPVSDSGLRCLWIGNGCDCQDFCWIVINCFYFTLFSFFSLLFELIRIVYFLYVVCYLQLFSE